MTRRLRSDADLAAAFAAGSFLLFKHSPTCPISAAAFAEYGRWTAAHPEVATGWIDVIAERALAGAVAERTGIRHQSPQAIWLREGKPEWNASHGAITEESLDEASA